MARPAAGYRTEGGKRVPGVTTIIKHLSGDPGGLIHWAWQLGADGKDYRKERDKAAGIGSYTHDLIEADITQKPADLSRYTLTDDEVKKADTAFQAYRQWREGSRLEIIATERALVSELSQYGGTIDAIGLINGVLCIIDWKTSNSVYPEYLAQVAAYSELWSECVGDEPQAAHLLRVGKDSGTFTHHYFPRDVLDTGLQAFHHCRALYDLAKELKKAI